MSRLVFVVVSDLFFASKIRATAEHLGTELRFVRNPESLTNGQTNQPDLVVVDLHSTNLDVVALAETLQADEHWKSVPLVGFYSHIDTELMQRAKLAGYTHVMPRSAFSNRLVEVLSGNLS